MNIGINGFGRIGKSILLQSIHDTRFSVKAINVPDFNMQTMISYLLHDSVHKHSLTKDDIYIINDNTVKILNKNISLLNKRNPEKNMWKNNEVDLLFDTTGKFLTHEKALLHDVNKFIMCAPSKDNTPQYLFNGNHKLYNGENIISNSSCTTNAIVPILKILDETYNVMSSNFLTVHAATASQNVIDGVHLKNRTHRTIINNIIPHSTGASQSAIKILPNLQGKLFGTSVRVPTINVSMVDLNVKLSKRTNLLSIINLLKNSNVVEINNDEHLVSSDFNTTTNPTILDKHASMELTNNEFKFTIWYDNEWSYSAQALNLANYIHNK